MLNKEVNETKKIITIFKKIVIKIMESQPGKKLTIPNNLKEKVNIIIISKTRESNEEANIDLRYIFSK